MTTAALLSLNSPPIPWLYRYVALWNGTIRCYLQRKKVLKDGICPLILGILHGYLEVVYQIMQKMKLMKFILMVLICGQEHLKERGGGASKILRF